MAYTTIDDPAIYFNTKLYTGTGSSLAITGIGFQPDWVWTKGRDSTAEGVMDHALVDSVRGVTKTLRSNTTGAEGTETNSLTAFGSDGYTVGANGKFNYSSSDIYVSWNWKAGTSFTNDASSTGIGSIDSTGSVNTTSGFSIVSYTGTGANATVGHGLSSVPKIVITRNRDTATNWCVYSSQVGNTKALFLNLTNTPDTGTAYWNDTTPTSSVFSVGTNTGTNKSGDGFVAYCFAEKKGFSKFGSYTGNGNADGTFVYTGFKPAFVLGKNTNAANGWYMFDNKRDVSNVVDTYLVASANAAEATYTALDFLSNGFKVRATNSDWNGSGNAIIYMAFAENPFVTSSGVPACAR